MAPSSPQSPNPELNRDPSPPSPISSLSHASDEDTAMAPRHSHRGAGQRPSTPRREADLSDVLTVPQKVELTTLLTDITNSMQQNIVQAFEASNPVASASPKDEPASKGLSWNLAGNMLPTSFDFSKLNLGFTSGAKEPEQDSGQARAASTTKLDDKARAMLDKEEKEALNTTQAELRKEALAYFKKWQAAVLKRVGDISVTKDNQGQQSRPGSSKGPNPKFANKPTSATPAAKSSQAGNQSQHTANSMSVEEADAALLQLYPPTATTLCSLPMARRTLLLHSLLLLVLSLENYSALSRVLLLRLASSLHVPLHVLAEDEVRVAKSLSQAAQKLSGEEATQKRSEENKNARRWKVGIASAAGAALIGVTGGLAAPLVAAGIGSVLGGIGLGTTAAAGLLGTMAESGLVVGTLFGIYGARGAGKMMDSYAKDIQDFAFLPLHGSLRSEFREAKEVPPEDRRLRLVIGISGWLTQKEDIVNPWRALGHESEVYALRWELEALMKMGTSLETVVKSAAWSIAKKEIIARTIFASLLQALWPLSLLRISKIVDNPWSVGMVRADKAGVVLADALLNRVQGERGVTLIGYSLGARVIYTCLMSLAERRAFGIVENVVLMGTPAPSDGRVWTALRSVVAGRVVNVFSENDYILAFLYRTSSIQFGVAGLQRIEGTSGVENVNATELVSGHLRYQYLVGTILRNLGWEDIDLRQVAQDEETLTLVEEKLEQDRRKREGQDEEDEAAQMEKEVKEKNEQQRLRA